MSPFDLTTLSALKAWLGLPSAAGPNDQTLAALITAASRMIAAALSRQSVLPQAYTDAIDLETRRVTLRQWPVLEITSVTWRGIPVAEDQSADLDASVGYALQPGDPFPPGRPQTLDLFGRCYRPGRQSLVVSYQAGYAVQDEAQTVPAAPPLTLTAFAPYGPWGSDLGVTYSATRSAADSGLFVAECGPIFGQRRRLHVLRRRRRAIGCALLWLRAAGHRAGGA